jgi:hypothetical protein
MINFRESDVIVGDHRDLVGLQVFNQHDLFVRLIFVVGDLLRECTVGVAQQPLELTDEFFQLFLAGKMRRYYAQRNGR